jgi:hypothetical protein
MYTVQQHAFMLVPQQVVPHFLFSFSFSLSPPPRAPLLFSWSSQLQTYLSRLVTQLEEDGTLDQVFDPVFKNLKLQLARPLGPVSVLRSQSVCVYVFVCDMLCCFICTSTFCLRMRLCASLSLSLFSFIF